MKVMLSASLSLVVLSVVMLSGARAMQQQPTANPSGSPQFLDGNATAQADITNFFGAFSGHMQELYRMMPFLIQRVAGSCGCNEETQNYLYHLYDLANGRRQNGPAPGPNGAAQNVQNAINNSGRQGRPAK